MYHYLTVCRGPWSQKKIANHYLHRSMGFIHLSEMDSGAGTFKVGFTCVIRERRSICFAILLIPKAGYVLYARFINKASLS